MQNKIMDSITWANKKMLMKMLMEGIMGTPGQEKPGGSVYAYNTTEN